MLSSLGWRSLGCTSSLVRVRVRVRVSNPNPNPNLVLRVLEHVEARPQGQGADTLVGAHEGVVRVHVPHQPEVEQLALLGRALDGKPGQRPAREGVRVGPASPERGARVLRLPG